jgi:2-haloalkanoic acid dehalogenase type II
MCSSTAESFKHVEALIFDVFGSFHLFTIDVLGTVVDWRKSVVDYLRTLPQPSTPLDHESFAQEWRHGYYLATRQFAESPDPSKFQTIDEIHFSILRDLVKKHKLESAWNENLLQEINLVWHRLHGWSDATQGLSMLKKRFIIGTLSNGNARLLIDMAKYADLPWDVIFSGDLLKAYKPNERMYLGACEYLQLPPEKVGMVFPL